MNKQVLRKQYRARRENLSLATKHAMLASMQDYFREIALKKGATVMSYKAMDSKQEVDPTVFEEVLEAECGVESFCFPAVHFAAGKMEAYLDDAQITWEEVRFGLKQPASGTIIPPEKIDIVLVPLLAFDLSGQRLGYGKGFYDGYLSRCRADVISIGLSWFEAEQTLPEIGAHDVPLKYCVTPQRLYVF